MTKIDPADEVLSRYDWQKIVQDLENLDRTGNWIEPEWSYVLRNHFGFQKYQLHVVILIGYRHVALRASADYKKLKSICGELYPEGIPEDSIDEAVAKRTQ